MNILYISYDGALDPLGASQVVPYLLGLAGRGVRITLVSFEKAARWARTGERNEMRRRLEALGIRWRPLRYHNRPRLAALVSNLVVGSKTIAYEASRIGSSVVHCRGDVSTFMTRCARVHQNARLLYDVRGFFSDERVETGSWKVGSALDRIVRRIEAGNLRRADGVVTLTRRAGDELRGRCSGMKLFRVIPTCADLSVFTPRVRSQPADFGLVYSGSLGTWYIAEQMVTFARLAMNTVPGRPLFLTPQPVEAKRFGATPDWADVRTVEPGQVPEWLRRCRALFFFSRAQSSDRARFPTKFAEALASGLPVLCNRQIGDLDDIVEREDVGILTDSFDDDALLDAARRLKHLLRDPSLSERCRRLAETHYSVDLGVDAYQRLYRELAGARINNCETAVSS